MNQLINPSKPTNELLPIDRYRFSAVIRQIWSLSYEEKQQLDHYFLLRTTGQELLDNLDQVEDELKQAPKIFIRHNGRQLSCHFISLTFDQLIEEPELSLLLSCRVHYLSNTWCCVVRKDEPRLSNGQIIANLNGLPSNKDEESK